jgi:hypothetical protein
MGPRDKMKFICSDSGNTKWFLDEEKKIFVRKDENMKIIGHIKAKNIPNPQELWDNRCINMGIPIGTESVLRKYSNGVMAPVRLKPSDAVFVMWENHDI